VGITRARQYLAISWSRAVPAPGRMRPAPPAPIYYQLKNYYEEKYSEKGNN